MLFRSFTTTVFDNHSGKNTSLIAPACLNFSTSSFMTFTCCLADLIGFCFLGRNMGSTFNLWVMKVGSTPSTSYGFHVKTSKFCAKDNSTATRSSSSRLFPTWKYLYSCGRILIWTNSLALLATVFPSSFCDCYNDSDSTCSFCLTYD